jgi:beta-lactamase class A
MRRQTALALLLFAAVSVSADPLEKRIAAIAARIDGVTGVAAVHLESGKRVALNPAEPFPMASVYKVPIAIVVLRQVDAGKLSLDRKVTVTEYHPGHSPLRVETGGKRATFSVRRLLEAMVSVSDNTASDVLLGLAGGANVVTRELATPGIRVDRTEMQMLADLRKGGADGFLRDPRDTSTPAAMTDLLARLWKRELGLSKSSHDLLVEAMIATNTGPNRIRAGVPAGANVAHKTGTWTAGANDAGIIATRDGSQHIAVAVFTKGGKAPTEEREAVINAIVREICGAFITPAAPAAGPRAR